MSFNFAGDRDETGTALLTDHYELTMVRAALASGTAHRRAVFEMFARHLPNGRRYGVVAGTGRLLDALQKFRRPLLIHDPDESVGFSGVWSVLFVRP